MIKIAKKLNYQFEVNHLKREFYQPKAHGDLLIDEFRYRKAIIDVLEGKRPLGARIVVDEKATENQKRLFDLLVKVLDGNQAILVKKEEEEK